MLGRALLTTTVLSCTFHLICLLILSGEQKDDLDVNTLRKSQRRNVNIQDLNEDLQRECQFNSSVNRMKRVQIVNAFLSATSNKPSIKELNSVSINDSDLKYMDKAIYDNHPQESTGHNVTMTSDRRTVISDNNSEHPKTILSKTNNNKEIIEYIKGKPNLKTVINFWERLAKIHKKVTIKNITGDTKNYQLRKTHNNTFKKNKMEIKQYSNVVHKTLSSKDVEDSYIKNMLPGFISNGKATIRKSTTSKSDDDTDIFKYILDNESLETHNINAHLSKYSYEFNYSKMKYQNQKLEKNNLFEDDYKPINVHNLISNDTKRHFIGSNENNKYSMERSKGVSTLVQPHISEFKMFSVRPTSAIPPEIIKQIAEDVKVLILKDWRKDLTDTTKSMPISTATKGTETTTIIYETKKHLVMPYVIERILEKIQKCNTNNDSNLIYKPEQDESNIFHNNLYPFMLPFEKDATKLENALTYLKFPYECASSKNIGVRINNPKGKTFIPIRNSPSHVSSINTSNRFKSMPITLQTNLLEIPPLGIPVSNPSSLINHNILPVIKNYKKIIKPTGSLFRQRLQNFPIRVNKLNNKESILPNINRYDDPPRNKAIKNNNSYRMRTQNNIKRFHENINHIQPNAEVSRDNCCREEIFTREQPPDRDMDALDESSFKNLLRTQKKVTDILTQILANRNEGQPPSVETT